MSQTVSIIIPTYKREKDLSECVASIAQQTVPPLEVIVVDDDFLPAMPGVQRLETAGIDCVYERKNGERGTSTSRNRGTELARGEFVLYLDDDVELEPEYIERMLEVFRNDPEKRIAGAAGFNTRHANPPLWKRIRVWPRLLFMIGGPKLGHILPSGFCTSFSSKEWPEGQLIDCDILPGNNMMCRRELVKDVSWMVDYLGYGLGEDQDFSYRLSRTHRLVLTGSARLIHKFSPVAKPDSRLMGRKKVFHQYRFYKNRVRRSFWQDLLFLYALLSHIALKFMVAVFMPSRKNWQRVLGLLEGPGMILAGRG